MGERTDGRRIVFGYRLPALMTVLVILILLAFMPNRIRLFPGWFFYGMGILILSPMVIVEIVADKTRWLLIERVTTLVTCIVCGVGMIMGLGTLIKAILYRSGEFSGLQLLSSGVALWITNVLVFTLIYWQIDRGGPQARLNNKSMKPDLHFPAQDLSADVASGWRPTFIDYLFLGFSTSTAFSMTEAIPLTGRAKVLMMVQSMISLITIVVVGARAINILGG